MKNQKTNRTTLVYLVGLVVLGLTNIGWAGKWGKTIDTKPLEQNNFMIELVVNQDQFEGNWKQFKGELKEKWGKFTDDDLLEVEGRMDKFEGKMQERYGDRKEELREWVDQWFEEHSFETQSKTSPQH